MLEQTSLALKLLTANPHDRAKIAQKSGDQIYRLMGNLSYLMRWLPLSAKIAFSLNGTDKDRDGSHKFGQHYDLFFRQYKWKKIKLLEIGIGGYSQSTGGRSINAWRWYFPFSKIVACDIVEKFSLANRGVKIYQIDQSSERDLARLVAEEKEFDIIIDDGSHVNAHQIFTFKQLFSALKNNGIYVIEDTQTSYWPHVGGHHIGESGNSCMDYFVELAHYLNTCEFLSFDDAKPDFVKIAESISMISFHHNLIFVKKDRERKFSNIVKKPT